MLTGKEIKRRREIGDIVIEPFIESRINPNSYNLSLNKKLLIYDNVVNAYEVEVIAAINGMTEEAKAGLSEEVKQQYAKIQAKPIIDPKANNKVQEIIIPEEGLVLFPGKLYLGQTNEYTETYGLIPALSGRSSIARLGISVHITAGFGDIGFKGVWTLEISVIEPVIIYPNMEFCQIYYDIPYGEYDEYTGRYQNSHEVNASRLFKDYE